MRARLAGHTKQFANRRSVLWRSNQSAPNRANFELGEELARAERARLEFPTRGPLEVSEARRVSDKCKQEDREGASAQ